MSGPDLTLTLNCRIEKAAREFVTLFLQVLDDGRLTDGQGRVVDFRNTVIIMTSNLGAAYLNENAADGPVPPAVKQNVMGTIQAHFPPEFVNRIDEIIVFRPLGRSSVGKIVELRLREVQERLVERKMVLDVDERAKDYLAARGYSPAYGARPLQRAIQSELLNPLSVMILGERVRDGETVRVTFDAPHNRLVVVPNHEGNGEEMDVDDDEWDEPQIVEMD